MKVSDYSLQLIALSGRLRHHGKIQEKLHLHFTSKLSDRWYRFHLSVSWYPTYMDDELFTYIIPNGSNNVRTQRDPQVYGCVDLIPCNYNSSDDTSEWGGEYANMTEFYMRTLFTLIHSLICDTLTTASPMILRHLCLLFCFYWQS